MWKRVLKYTLFAYLVYFAAAGVFSYLWPMPPSRVKSPDEYYGDTEGPDRVLLVETPQDAFARRLEVIGHAERTLDVTYYCIKDGQTTDAFFGKILEAADRGVQVRILLDGAMGGTGGGRGSLPEAMALHPNIQFSLYNPVNPLKPWQWNARLHDKFILADDKYLLLGGRNIGDEYFAPPYYDGAVTHDRDVLVLNTAGGTDTGTDSVVTQVQAYMETLWTSPDVATVQVPAQQQAAAEAVQQKLRTAYADFLSAYPDYVQTEFDCESGSFPTNKITLVHNPIQTFKKEPWVGADLAALLKTGKQVQVQSPYCTANKHTLAAFTQIAEHTETFRLITNSMASSPNYPAFSNYVTQRQKFLDTGVSIFEYQSTDSIHAKSALMDGRIAVVGSFNLDDRSLYIDTETVLVIDSPAFHEVLQQEFDGLYAQSAQVGADNAYIAGSGAAPLAVPAAKRLLMYGVSVLSRLFQFLI